MWHNLAHGGSCWQIAGYSYYWFSLYGFPWRPPLGPAVKDFVLSLIGCPWLSVKIWNKQPFSCELYRKPAGSDWRMSSTGFGQGVTAKARLGIVLAVRVILQITTIISSFHQRSFVIMYYAKVKCSRKIPEHCENDRSGKISAIPSKLLCLSRFIFELHSAARANVSGTKWTETKISTEE